ncbi:hypothetical protein B0H11DRAFT_2274499 [Mycena galericulata]|nr:hypothetical protein B0H11DRAFT_2274499 [Mycena galericulata]
MILLEEDAASSSKAGPKLAQPESEPGPPPYEEIYEDPSASTSAAGPLLQPNSHALEDPDKTQPRSHVTRRRRFLRFFLVAVVLVVAFSLVRSFTTSASPCERHDSICFLILSSSNVEVESTNKGMADIDADGHDSDVDT